MLVSISESGEQPMQHLWPLAIVFALSIAACGEDPAPAPAAVPNNGPSVADLLAATSEPTSPPESAAGENDEPPAPAPSEEPPATAGGANDAPEEAPDDAACAAARDALKDAQKRLDKARERSLTPLQDAASKAQVSFENCMTAGKTCTDNASKFKSLLAKRDATAERVSAALNKISTQEADLFPLSQAVDRACN